MQPWQHVELLVLGAGLQGASIALELAHGAVDRLLGAPLAELLPATPTCDV